MFNGNFIVNQIMNNPKFKNNTVMQNAIRMYQQGDEKGLVELCNNVCKNNGTSYEEMKNKANKMFN